MSKLHNFFGVISNPGEVGGDRPSRNDYGYQLLEKIDIEQFRSLLNGLSAKDLRTITDLLRIRSISANHVSTSHAKLIQTTALKLYASGSTRVMSDIIARKLETRSRELLGEHFSNPSARQITSLTDTLIEEFGQLKTKWFYGGAIDRSANATPHLLKELSSRAELSIDLYVHDDSPIELPEARPAPTEQLKISRKDKRKQDRDARALRRSQESDTRQAEKKRLEAKKKPLGVGQDLVSDTDPSSTEPIQIAKLQHRHLTRFLKASTDHEEVGMVKWAFISFQKDDPNEGKDRPVVVVAVAPRYYIVRPVYSRASRYAGWWRAVLLSDWQHAGLLHESVVGHKTQKVTKDKIRGHVGELTISDWNRICRGEVNTSYDS